MTELDIAAAQVVARDASQDVMDGLAVAAQPLRPVSGAGVDHSPRSFHAVVGPPLDRRAPVPDVQRPIERSIHAFGRDVSKGTLRPPGDGPLVIGFAGVAGRVAGVGEQELIALGPAAGIRDKRAGGAQGRDDRFVHCGSEEISV